MWWPDARRSHFCDVFIDGDGAARTAVTSGAINQHIAALSKTGPAELPARTRELVNELPWMTKVRDFTEAVVTKA